MVELGVASRLLGDFVPELAETSNVGSSMNKTLM